MPTSNTEELGRFLKCTVIGRGVFGPSLSGSYWLDHLKYQVNIVQTLKGIFWQVHFGKTKL